jgi:hypothetical protein
MQNIKFSYLYRDGGNYKNFGSVVFKGDDQIKLEDLEVLIKSKLIDGTWFYASQWRLPDLHFSIWDNEADHTFHEFEALEYTDETVNIPFTLQQFIFLINQ